MKYLEIQSLSIVFIGEFNPVIISPHWLALKELIREEEATNANVGVIHDDLVQYNLDWVSIEITRKRCEFKTSKTPYFDMVRDLASSIFQILRETPIASLGMNHIFELKMPSKEKYHQIGAELTNLSIWDDNFKSPKLMNLEIVESERYDEFKGSYRVRISPTGGAIKFGVRIDINDHISINSESETAYEVLLSNWDNSFKKSEKITSKFIEKIKI